MSDKTRRQIKRYVKSLKWTPKDFYWKHALLVKKFSLMIQKKVGGDKDIVEISALMHDVGKAKLLAPGHEKISAKLTEQFLKKIKFNKDKIQKIVNCIKYENFETIEAKILSSADSISLIMDTLGGREWFFENVLKNKKARILKELEKSYSEIEFDFARRFIRERYKSLLKKYKAFETVRSKLS
jgi:hypothetical protein